ncbi:MAG: hypothetical protein GPJ21_21280 [Microcystis aeruginosa W13-11]|jgi:hypothetical protein|nr:hypothetical protein [Microcystis aeruginosa W13-11]
MTNSINYFESFLRKREESVQPTFPIDVDNLLSFKTEDKKIFIDHLSQYYGNTHWSSNTCYFNSTSEAALQVFATGVCRLKHHDRHQKDDLDCCIRLVHSPSLSPYVLTKPYSYIIVPSGFISSLQMYVSTIYALSIIGAESEDSTQTTLLWRDDMILGALLFLWEKDQYAFLHGILMYSSELCVAHLLDSFSDLMASIAFHRQMHSEMQNMLPSIDNLRKQGFTSIQEVLGKSKKVQATSNHISRILLFYSLSHEFGHLFLSLVDKEVANLDEYDNYVNEYLRSEEGADLFGMQIVWRLYETGNLSPISYEGCTSYHVVAAMLAFHSWNLSKVLSEILSRVMNVSSNENINSLFDRLNQTSLRWQKACRAIKEIMPEKQHFTELYDSRGDTFFSSGQFLVNQWSIPCAGLLMMILRTKGFICDIYDACDLLDSLMDKESEVYAYLITEKNG